MANEPFMDRWTLNGTEVLLQDHGRDQANGVPVLNSEAKLPLSYLPQNYASALKVDPRDPYNDNFVDWVADLASSAYRNRGQTWSMLNTIANCVWHKRLNFKSVDVLLLIYPSTSAARNANEGVYWTDNWSDFNKTTESLLIRPSSIDANDTICVVGSVGSTTAPVSKGGVIWSEDGKNWTRATGIEDTRSVYNVRYVPFLDIWVCMVHGVGLYWSNNGKSWTQGTGGAIGTPAYLGVFSNIIIASYSNTMWWSEDGKNWTQCTADGTFSRNTIVQGYKISFCIYKFSGGYYSSKGDWSLDGKSWHVNSSNPSQTDAYLLTLKNGYFYGSNASRVSDVTSNGPVIEPLSSTDIDPIPNFFVYSPENGKYYTFKYDTSTSTMSSYASEDGIQFHFEGSTSNVGAGYSMTHVNYCKGLFVISNNSGSNVNGKWVASVDGKTFFTPNTAFSPVEDLFVQNKKWYALSTHPFETEKYVWVPPELY